jgi:hypothetical protein
LCVLYVVWCVMFCVVCVCVCVCLEERQLPLVFAYSKTVFVLLMCYSVFCIAFIVRHIDFIEQEGDGCCANRHNSRI